MSASGAPVGGTARILLVGTLLSAACFVVGVGLTLLAQPFAAAIAARSGVLSLLLTPAFSLLMTAIELRRPQPASAVLALAVLGVLGIAVAIALFAA